MKSKPALILIDIQKGFADQAYFGGNRNNPDAEKNSATLLTLWRKSNLPVFHVKHNSLSPRSPLRPGQPGNEFQESVKPLQSEPVIEKSVNSAFIGTPLQALLVDQHIESLVIVGLTTNHCVSTTTRMAGNFGYETFLIGDATACFDRKGVDGKVYLAELIHQTALANLNEEFATVLSTKEMIAVIPDP